jgi:hypothetical protein
MLKLLSYIELPPVQSYKRRWVRRIMIPLTIPQELLRSAYYVFASAAFCWRQP